ncbi:MAG: ankyrin repeat domain-containing protein [Steroidobacteraceae bacterium]
MSKVSPSQDQMTEVDHLYRRLSALDPARPGEWVRRRVQAYAAQQAAERAVRANAKAKEIRRSEAPTLIATAIPAAAGHAANKPWLLPVTFGAIAAAALVGFLVLPHLMAHHDTPNASLSPAPVAQPETATPQPQVAQVPAPRSPESVLSAPPSPSEQLSAPVVPASPPPVAQPPVTTSLAQTPVVQKTVAQTQVVAHLNAPVAPAVAPGSASTLPVQSPTRAAVVLQNAAAATPIASARAETSTQTARSSPPAESAPPPKVPSAPSADTQVASAPPGPAATASATQPAPTPATGATIPPDELWDAAKSGDMDGLQAALASNADVNALSADGQTALTLAIRNNHLDVVRALLAHGANPNLADSRGFTPLRAARIRGNFAILTALERNGRH